MFTEKSVLPAFTENHLLSFQVVFSSKSHDGVINPDNPQENQWHRGIFNMDFKSKKYLISENERTVLMQAFKELQNIMISKDESLHFVTLTFGNDEWEIIPQNVAEAACIEHLMQCMSAGKASKISEVVKSGLNKGIIGLDHIHILKYGLVHQYDSQGNKQQMRFFVLVPGKLFGFQQEKKKLGYPATLVTSLLNAKVVTVPEVAGFQLHVDASDPLYLDAVQEVDRPSWIKEINASIEFTKDSIEGIIVKNPENGGVKQQDKSKAEHSGNGASTSKSPKEQPSAQPKKEQPAEQPKKEQPPAQPKKEQPAEQPKKEQPPAQPKKEQPAEQPKKEQPPTQPKKEHPYEQARKDHASGQPKQENKPGQTRQDNMSGPSRQDQTSGQSRQGQTQGQNQNEQYTSGQNTNEHSSGQSNEVLEENEAVQPIAQSIMECDDQSATDIESCKPYKTYNPYNPYKPSKPNKQKFPKSEARVVLEVSLSELDSMLGQIKATNVLSELHRFSISNCGDMQKIASMSPKHWSAVNEITKALNGLWSTSASPVRQELVIASKAFPNSQVKPETSRWSASSRGCLNKFTTKSGLSLQAPESALVPFPLQGTDTSRSGFNSRRCGQRGKEPITTLSGMSKADNSYISRNRSQGSERFSSDMPSNARQVSPNRGIMQENPLYDQHQLTPLNDQHQLTSYNECRESVNRMTSDSIRNMRLCHNEVFDPNGNGNSAEDVESVMSDEPEIFYTDLDLVDAPFEVTGKEEINCDKRGLSSISPRNANPSSNISPRSSISHRDLLYQTNAESLESGRSKLPVQNPGTELQKPGTELSPQSSRLARIRHKMQEFVISETDHPQLGKFPQSRTLAEYRKSQLKEKRSNSRSKSRFSTSYAASDFERKFGSQSSRRNSKISNARCNPQNELAASTHQGMISQMQIGNAPISSMQMGNASISSMQMGNAPISSMQMGNAPISSMQMGNAPISSMQIGNAPISPRQIGYAPISPMQMGNVPISRYTSFQPLGAAIMNATKTGLRSPVDECNGMSRGNESFSLRNPVDDCSGMSRVNEKASTANSAYPVTRSVQRFDTIIPGKQTSHIRSNFRSEESSEINCPVVSVYSQPSIHENRNTNYVMSNPTGCHPNEASRPKAPMGSYKTNQYNQATGSGIQQNGNLRSNAAPVMSNNPHASNMPQPANLQRNHCTQALGQDVKPSPHVQQNRNLRSNNAPGIPSNQHVVNVPVQMSQYNQVQQNRNTRSHDAAVIMPIYQVNSNMPEPHLCQYNQAVQPANLQSNQYNHATVQEAQTNNLVRNQYNQAMVQEVKPSAMSQQNRNCRSQNVSVINSYQRASNVPEPLIFNRSVMGISMDGEVDDDEMNYHSQVFQSADF